MAKDAESVTESVRICQGCWSVQALELHSLRLADMLQQTYSVSLARETLLGSLLQQIRQTYLGAPAVGGQDLVSNMMQMLMGSSA